MSETGDRSLLERLLAAGASGTKKAPSLFSELTRQQLCAALGISESTVRRLEQSGLPFTPIGKRSKRYNLDECKIWLKENSQCQSGTMPKVGNTSALWSAAKELTESCRKVQLRVKPS